MLMNRKARYWHIQIANGGKRSSVADTNLTRLREETIRPQLLTIHCREKPPTHGNAYLLGFLTSLILPLHAWMRTPWAETSSATLSGTSSTSTLEPRRLRHSISIQLWLHMTVMARLIQLSRASPYIAGATWWHGHPNLGIESRTTA